MITGQRIALTLSVVLTALCTAGEENSRAPIAPQSDIDPANAPARKPNGASFENIALGASYTLRPAPNYEHCTDPDDTVQLTDGEYSEGYFWVQPSTVGWKNASPIVITLDLGEVKPIRGASFHTAAGRAGVSWPLAIYVLAADEDKQFHQVGDLVALGARHGLPPEDYATHRYWTDALQTHGRYVAFVCAAKPYAFVDEIEVYGGDPAWLDQPFEGRPIFDIEAFMRDLQVRESIMRRFRRDIAAVRDAANNPKISANVRPTILSELDAIERAMQTIEAPAAEGFRAVLPLDELHARVFNAQAALWLDLGYSPLTVWQSDLWGPLSHTE
ncbi:MAG TPA: hypothetical protein ENN80_07165, partial [Candidatus Hydrogenedentes bacterium]|nr:hypothetical protein [Candidatus Hydrogenedentota bacterium]